MFTGIIEAAGRVIDVHETPGGVRLTVDTSGLEQALAAGESLAVNGVCLTAVQPTQIPSLPAPARPTALPALPAAWSAA